MSEISINTLVHEAGTTLGDVNVVTVFLVNRQVKNAQTGFLTLEVVL